MYYSTSVLLAQSPVVHSPNRVNTVRSRSYCFVTCSTCSWSSDGSKYLHFLRTPNLGVSPYNIFMNLSLKPDGRWKSISRYGHTQGLPKTDALHSKGPHPTHSCTSERRLCAARKYLLPRQKWKRMVYVLLETAGGVHYSTTAVCILCGPDTCVSFILRRTSIYYSAPCVRVCTAVFFCTHLPFGTCEAHSDMYGYGTGEEGGSLTRPRQGAKA